MKILIVDDETPARNRLKRMLDGLEGVEVIGEATDGQAAIDAARELKPHIILLDIRMPGMDGMEAARQIRTLPDAPYVIFTTAYSEHALEAFDTQAIDYLVKPVRKERLLQALERVQQLLPADTSKQPSNLTVKKQGKMVLLPIDEILYFQADHKYVTAYLATREELLEESLKQLEELLGERVIRIHRNALVARSALMGMEKDASSGSHHVTLREIGKGPEISRRHVAEVRQIIKEMV